MKQAIKFLKGGARLWVGELQRRTLHVNYWDLAIGIAFYVLILIVSICDMAGIQL